MAATSITPQELKRRHDSGQTVELIDVRTPVEFREVHLGFARNVPLDGLDPPAISKSHSEQQNGEPLYVICHAGGRGAKACQQLHDAGLTNVVNVEGGTSACLDVGLPLVRGKKAISLERQVRIAAGSIVLAGAALAWWAHPGWVGLSAFVGAGLVFAGITDTCGMGMLLARMPWNR